METRDRLYRSLARIRLAEQKIMDVYMDDVMQCPVHLSIGQESVAAALCAHLTGEDLKTGTHRSHAIYLANGGCLTAFFGELLGRQCGCSRGYGGSMHLIDQDHGLVGTTSIVGGALPISVGLAMAVERPRVAAVLFGDAAADEGVFAESVNFAQLRNVPLVMVCENNHYSVYTPQAVRRARRPIAVAEAFGMDAIDVPIEQACDVFALYELLAEPIQRVRQGSGPLMIECETVRRYDHNGIRDDIEAGFRDAREAERFEAYCPIKTARQVIGDRRADELEAEVSQEVEAAYQAAFDSEPVVLEFQHR